MNVHTTSQSFNTSPEKLFDFISDIENLPTWATGFCLSLRKEGEDYLIMTSMGEMYFEINANQEMGIVDMKSGPSKEMMMTWPARVTSNNVGGSIFSFTAIQMPGQSDAEFAGQCESLLAEFDIIRKHSEG